MNGRALKRAQGPDILVNTLAVAVADVVCLLMRPRVVGLRLHAFGVISHLDGAESCSISYAIIYIRNFAYDEYDNMSVSSYFAGPWNGLTPLNTTGNPYNPANNRLLSSA
jgi:hypothetical protein